MQTCGIPTLPHLRATLLKSIRNAPPQYANRGSVSAVRARTACSRDTSGQFDWKCPFFWQFQQVICDVSRLAPFGLYDVDIVAARADAPSPLELTTCRDSL